MRRRWGTVARLALGAVAAGLLACALRPQPLTPEARQARAREDLALLFAGQNAPEGSLDLYRVMAWAVRSNLDHRVKQLEHALADRRLTEARADLLPGLVANQGYYGRDSFLGSSSESLLSGTESLEPSTSQERHAWRSDLTLAWNVLDFGLSYVRAAQQADEVLITEERRVRAVQRIVKDVRRTYWRAVAAQRLLPQTETLLADVHAALARSQELEQERMLDPMRSLAYRRSLLQKLDEVVGLRSQLETAQVELASLVSARPGVPLELVAPSPEELPIPNVPLPVEALESDALESRPELREEDYQLRISQLEVRRAMLSVLPGIELSVGRNRDSNEFLVNNTWWSYSAVLSKNLIEMVTAPSRIRMARAGTDLAQMRRLALSMAVIAQVHVAHRNFEAAGEAFRLAREARGVDGRMAEIARHRLAAGSESELELIRSETEDAIAELRLYLAYADLQDAYGQLLNSLGVRPLPEDGAPEDVETLAMHLRRAEARWRRHAEIRRDYPDAVVEHAPANASAGGD